MPRNITELPFYINDDMVGILTRDHGDDLVFNYSPHWKRGPISPALPLEGARGDGVRAWFRELMPDDQRRFSQALGNDRKYETQDDGIGMGAISKLLLGRVGKKSIRDFLQMTFFSMYIGNYDDHAGNYALLQDLTGDWKVAPAYDLVSVACMQELQKKGLVDPRSMLHMILPEQSRAFGAHYDAMEIDAHDILEVSDLFQIPADDMMSLAGECNDRIAQVLNSDFLENAHDEWRQLEFQEYPLEIVETSFRIFPATILERSEKVWSNIRSAFENRHIQPMR